jgi:hypothetical protein
MYYPKYANFTQDLRKMTRPWYVAHKGEVRNTYKILIGMPEWKIFLEELSIEGRNKL